MIAIVPDVEDRWQAIFNRASDGIVTTDEAGLFVDVNPAACKMFGRPRDQVVGRHFREIMAPPETAEEIRRTLDELGTLTGEFSVWRPDGSIREIQFDGVSRFIPGFNMSILRDVTERRSREDVALQLAALVNASDDAFVLDASAREYPILESRRRSDLRISSRASHRANKHRSSRASTGKTKSPAS